MTESPQRLTKKPLPCDPKDAYSEANLQRAAQVLKELYSSVPWHARAAAKDPNYWRHFASSVPMVV